MKKCESCGKEIPDEEYEINGGLCDNCYHENLGMSTIV